MDFAVLADHYRVKIKESENMNKYLDLVSKLKKSWNMKVTLISIVVGVLETVLSDLENRLDELEIRGRIETIQNAAL